MEASQVRTEAAGLEPYSALLANNQQCKAVEEVSWVS